jgi:hypothetical protein
VVQTESPIARRMPGTPQAVSIVLAAAGTPTRSSRSAASGASVSACASKCSGSGCLSPSQYRLPAAGVPGPVLTAG